MERNFTSEFQNSPLHDNCGDDCRRQQKHFEENNYHAIAVCVVNIPLCLTALLGNFAILITIWKTPSLHTASYLLLASLAASDLAVGLIVQPFLISLLLTAIYDFPPSAFRFICLGFNYVAYVLCGVSLLNITAIGLDRFLALWLHLRYNAVVTTYRVNLAITAIWLFQGLSMINVFWSRHTFQKPVAIVMCVLILANFVIYLKIRLIVRRHQVEIQHRHPEANAGNFFSLKRVKKSALNTFLVFLVFLFCYVPHTYVFVTGGGSLTVYYVTTTIVLLNSSLNPLLYCWRVREMREATKQMFCSSIFAQTIR